MRPAYTFILFALLLFPAASGGAEKGLTVTGVRYATYATFTRIVFEIEAAAPYVLTRSQDGRSLLLSSYEGPFNLKAPLPAIRDSVVAGMEPWEEGGRTYAVIRLATAAGAVKDFTLRSPDRIVLDISKGTAAGPPPAPLNRQFVVVLDPGHGGKDLGILTARGLEKSADLELAAAIGKRLAKVDGIKVLLTHRKDRDMTLDERAAFANAAGASVFVSIHAAPAMAERVYIQDVLGGLRAAPAPPVTGGDFLGYEAATNQQDMIWGKQQAAHAEQSGSLGRRIARKLAGGAAEPIQAPLAGLEAVDAAAVIVEVGMEQNRSKAAGEIAGGIAQYVADNR